MAIDWDTTFKLPRMDLRDRLYRVKLLDSHAGLRSRIFADLLDHTDHNVYITIGGLVTILNTAISTYCSELTLATRSGFSLFCPTLYQQLTEALIDNTAIRQVVLESLYDTNQPPPAA